jgi:uncharacterized protein (TIGR04206 family)
VSADGRTRRTDRPRARLAVALVPFALPWSVQLFSRADATLLFPWGLVNTSPPTVTTLYGFLFVYTAGLPGFILAWPLSAACALVGVAGVAAGAATGREDRRVTAAAFACAGVAQLSLAWGFSLQPSRTAWPTGTLVCWAVALVLVRRGRQPPEILSRTDD